MPRADYEALEAKRRARRGRGVDSDEETVVGDKTDPEEDQSSVEETTKETTIEAVLRQSTVDMFRRVLMFSDGAATSLYDDQMITTFDVLRELDDDTIKETCRAATRSPRFPWLASSCSPFGRGTCGRLAEQLMTGLTHLGTMLVS